MTGTGKRYSAWLAMVLGFVMMLWMRLHLERPLRTRDTGSIPKANQAFNSGVTFDRSPGERDWFENRGGGASAQSIVAGKVAQFARSRRGLARMMAQRKGVQVLPEVEAFFDAVESGNWDEIEKKFQVIAGNDSSAGQGGERLPEVNAIWPSIIDAFGAAEQAHLWPADKLLDYGYSILDSLRPGMVYVGGTDAGRWVPALVNEGEQNQHIVITQNGLADRTYAEYMDLQFGGELSLLTEEDSKRTFEEYVEDARKRLEHDQNFPDEPKQIRPGEDIKLEKGQISVGGQTAVMAINEKLLTTILERNPNVSFALAESFPLPGTYREAVPLGPLMELRAGTEGFGPEKAQENMNFWHEKVTEIMSDPQNQSTPEVLRSYSHDVAAAANLLAARHFEAEAESTYRLSAELWPGNALQAAGLADLLRRSGRGEEAEQIVREFSERFPEARKDLDNRAQDLRIISGP